MKSTKQVPGKVHDNPSRSRPGAFSIAIRHVAAPTSGHNNNNNSNNNNSNNNNNNKPIVLSAV